MMRWSATAAAAVLGIVWAASVAHANADLPVIERIVRGTVLIERAATGRYERAQVGDTLGQQDAVLLRGERSRLDVRCPNNRLGRSPVRDVLSGIQAICPDVTTVRRSRDEDEFLALLRGDFPYVTGVPDGPVVLRWPEMAGAEAGYRVAVYRQVRGELTEQLWATTVAEEWVAYGGPALVAGETYGLVVEPGAAGEPLCGKRDGAGDAGLERWRSQQCLRTPIQLLTAELSPDLQALQENLADLAVDEETAALALAHRYGAAGLYWPMMDLLEPLVAGETALASGYRLLGDAYLQAGWMDAAAVAYGRALRMSTVGADRQTPLAAAMGLAKVAAWQGDQPRAADYLWRALGESSRLRDGEQADLIVQLLRKLD
jgi:hypothetical protein